jgi:hypothetical protein
MASQKRRFNFQGSDQEYIAYLESLLLDVRDAYRAPLSQPYQPSRPSPASPPSPPFSPSLSPTDVGDEVIDNFKGDDVSTNSLKLVWYQPPKDEAPHCSKRGAKRKRPEPDWERVMDKMVSEIAAKDWSSRRREVGLSTDTGIIAALDWIIYGARSQGDTVATKTDPSVSLYRPSDAVLHLMSAFATTTAALEVETTFTSQMFSFRVFVFVSLCCVAIHNGAKLEHINEIMRKCVSDSSEKNLTRLRKGALWVNRMMFELSEDGFGHSAYEVFVLCKLAIIAAGTRLTLRTGGGPLCQYGKFAEAGNLSISYFKSRILQHKPEIEIQAPLPFWVPFIIQTIVGNVFR